MELEKCKFAWYLFNDDFPEQTVKLPEWRVSFHKSWQLWSFLTSNNEDVVNTMNVYMA
jgi:hypothetical protein